MPGPRDHEPIEGNKRYKLLALKYIRDFHYNIPREEWEDAAELAARETIAAVGERSRLGIVTPIIRHYLKAQEYAWGLRQEGTQDGKIIRRPPDVTLSTLTLISGDYHNDLEAGRPAGVGEFTTWAARELDRRVNKPEPLKPRPTARDVQQLVILDQLLEEDPNLRKVLEEWQQSPHRNMAELCQSPDLSYNWTVHVLRKNRLKARELMRQAEVGATEGNTLAMA